MAISQVTLSASARANLLSLQSTAKMLGTTQERLSTGNKVNSALDGAASYFASKGFLNTANDLSTLKDSMSTALQTIKAASNAIESITDVVEQLQGIVNSALQSTDADTRAAYAIQYDSLLSQLDDLADDATFNGTNLVNNITTNLRVNFNTTNTTGLTVAASNLKSDGLGVGAAQGKFADDAQAKQVTSNLTVVQTNQAATGTYSGTFSNLTVSGAAGTGVGAVITSTNGAFAGAAGALITIASDELTTDYDSGTSATQANLGYQLANSGLTVTSGSAISSTTLDSAAAITINGSFSITGGASSTFNGTTFTAGSEATIVSLATGQSIEVNIDGTKTVYTNQSATTRTFFLDSTGTADTVALNRSDSAITYALTAGTVTQTGLTADVNATLNGNAIVSTGGLTSGSITTVETSDGVGQALGTTTQTGIVAYDLTGTTVSGLTFGKVTATKTGTAAATYAANAPTAITFSGATVLSGSSTTVVADALLTAQTQLSNALTTLRSASAALGNNNTLVQTRSDYTTNLINTLQTASDNLVLADSNEEGANLQTLQARNQLGIVSLGISGQLAQSVLKLF